MIRAVLLTLAALMLQGCAFWLDQPPTASPRPEIFQAKPEYRIGPGDNLQIFVWRNPEITTTVPVRPDGRVSIPLVQDIQAAGKTPSQLADDLTRTLSEYIKDPLVTVIVQSFQGAGDGRVSVVGEAATPRSVPYRAGLTLLDVMIEVGGLTEFADGNDSRLVRLQGEEAVEYRVRIADLMKDGDATANVELAPGDIIRIPERWF